MQMKKQATHRNEDDNHKNMENTTKTIKYAF